MNHLHSFLEVLSNVGAFFLVVVAAIVVLTLFFKGISWLGGKKPDTLSVRGVIAKTTLVTVHMATGKSFDSVRLVGFTSAGGSKARLPWELNGMVILADEQNQRYLVRARDIKMIVVPPESD